MEPLYDNSCGDSVYEIGLKAKLSQALKQTVQSRVRITQQARNRLVAEVPTLEVRLAVLCGRADIEFAAGSSLIFVELRPSGASHRQCRAQQDGGTKARQADVFPGLRAAHLCSSGRPGRESAADWSDM